MLKDLTDGKIQEYPELLLHVDGGCEPRNPGGIATCGWAIFHNSTLLVESHKVVKDGGPLATNNYAEYCALGLALRWLNENGWRGILRIKADSKLLVEQVNSRWKCKAEHLIPLREKIWQIFEELELKLDSNCFLQWVPREQNTCADELTNIAYREYVHAKWKNESSKS